MINSHRRQRISDPLATRESVRGILASLRSALPEIIPSSDKELVSMLRAALHAERHPTIRTRRGRRSRWRDHELERVSSAFRATIERGTKRVSLRSFVEHYLLILDFPEDVAAALERGEINLFEAEQLARLTPRRTGLSAEKMRKRRQHLLRIHLKARESGARLKARVDSLLYLYRNPSAVDRLLGGARPSAEILDAAERLEAEIESERHWAEDMDAEISPDHIFYEYLQIIEGMMRELRAEIIPEPVMERIIELSEKLIQQLNSEHKRQFPPAEAVKEAAKSFHI